MFECHFHYIFAPLCSTTIPLHILFLQYFSIFSPLCRCTYRQRAKRNRLCFKTYLRLFQIQSNIPALQFCSFFEAGKLRFTKLTTYLEIFHFSLIRKKRLAFSCNSSINGKYRTIVLDLSKKESLQ